MKVLARLGVHADPDQLAVEILELPVGDTDPELIILDGLHRARASQLNGAASITAWIPGDR